jgi:hypothetical protein
MATIEGLIPSRQLQEQSVADAAISVRVTTMAAATLAVNTTMAVVTGLVKGPTDVAIAAVVKRMDVAIAFIDILSWSLLLGEYPKHGL